MNFKPAMILARAAAMSAALALTVPHASAFESSAYQPPEPVPEFPVKSVVDAGADPVAFMAALAPLYDGSMSEVHSILVLSGGALVYEDYFVGNNDRVDFDAGLVRVPGDPRQWGPDDPHFVSSVSKTVTALITGIALGELGWSLDEPLAPHLKSHPWLLAGDKSGITVRHVLTMTTGLEWNEWQGSSMTELWTAKARFRHLASIPMAAEPGAVWNYNSATENVLLLALDGAVPGSIREFADEHFFRPLAINNYRWGEFDEDIPDGGARLFLRPRSMAKIGLLVLNGGEYGGQQVVPREFMKAAFSKQVSTRPATEHDYGYLTWIRSLAIEGGEPVEYVAIEGDGGNHINIFPDRGLIVVTTGGHYRDWPSYEPQIQTLLKRIVPVFPIR